MNKSFKNVFLAAASLSAVAVAAQAPKVSNVTMEQDQVSRVVTIGYDLDEASDPGIVTFDILTNGVSIGEENLKYAVGDLGRIQVPDGNRKTIKWPAAKAWPGHNIKEACVTARVTAWSTNNPPPVMVVDLKTKEKSFYTHLAQLPGGIADKTYKTDKLVMKRIPAAGVTWVMGDSVSASPNAMHRPHRVSFSSDFYIGVYEVTQKQLELVTGRNRTSFTDFSDAEDADIMPADKVGYGQISGSSPADMQLRGYNKWPADGHTIAAGSAIISKFRLLGVDFDLPTSAQWEYACRAGTASIYNNGAGSGLEHAGWYSGNSSNMPHPVGGKDPNNFGLYDMHGNVSEWVLDWYDPDGSSIKDYDVDPNGLESASSAHSVARTWRGGSYKSNASGCCSYIYGNRNWNAALESGFGFRLWAPAGVCE